jgi:hypothetical protein
MVRVSWISRPLGLSNDELARLRGGRQRPRSSDAPIPLLIWLQYLRVLLDRWRSVVGLKGIVAEEVLWTIRELGITARAANLNAYGCLCLDLAEQMEDLAREDRSARGVLDLLSEWVDHSERYVCQPSDPQSVRALLEGLNGSTWHAPFDKAERDILIQDLVRGVVKI